MTPFFLSKKFLFVGSLLIFGGVIFFVKRDEFFFNKTKSPLQSRDTTIVLSQDLENAGLSPSSLTIIDTGTIQASISGIAVAFSTSKDFSQQVRALQLVLSRRTIDKTPKEIDLRFNNVVVRY